MTERRFHEGDTFSIPPMEYRLVQGKKSPDDLRLDWRWVGANGRSMWQPVSLDQVAFIVDALADNENVLYPPPRYDGGARVLSFVRMVGECPRSLPSGPMRGRLIAGHSPQAEQALAPPQPGS
jgi:hypothetical protein